MRIPPRPSEFATRMSWVLASAMRFYVCDFEPFIASCLSIKLSFSCCFQIKGLIICCSFCKYTTFRFTVLFLSSHRHLYMLHHIRDCHFHRFSLKSYHSFFFFFFFSYLFFSSLNAIARECCAIRWKSEINRILVCAQSWHFGATFVHVLRVFRCINSALLSINCSNNYPCCRNLGYAYWRAELTVQKNSIRREECHWAMAVGYGYGFEPWTWNLWPGLSNLMYPILRFLILYLFGNQIFTAAILYLDSFIENTKPQSHRVFCLQTIYWLCVFVSLCSK